MNPSEYWKPVCQLVHQLNCRARVTATDRGKSWSSIWGTLLIIPQDGFIEPSDGPVPIRTVDWVEVALERSRGGKFGIPLSFVDVSDEVVTLFRQLTVTWELRDTSWSVDGLFDERPVRVIHLPNPFRSDD